MSGSTNRSTPLFPPLKERLAMGQPVFTEEQARLLSRQVMKLVRAERATVEMTHTVRSLTRLAQNRISGTEEGEHLDMSIWIGVPNALEHVFVRINQLDVETLHAYVAKADALLTSMTLSPERLMLSTWDEQDLYRPAQLWHESTVQGLHTAQERAIPAMLDAVHQPSGRGGPFTASGFVGLTAQAQALLTERGITAYVSETDSEVSVTARSADGHASGWAGQAGRDWAAVDPARVATSAADLAARSVGAVAVEPGRRTAILAPGAVVQFMRFLAYHFQAGLSQEGLTGFSKVPRVNAGIRWNERFFDPRVQISSDPADSEGGFQTWFGGGYANPAVTWIDHGVLKNLSMPPGEALSIGKPYAETPYGFRFHGGDLPVEQMIANCPEGIYVNRVSSMDIVDEPTGMLTGVTSDGCFLVKNGKIDRPVKNFRFYTSPFFFLNSLVGMGPAVRAAYGYAPPTQNEWRLVSKDPDFFTWPRRPMIVPPLMVHDFNFSALIDAI